LSHYNDGDVDGDGDDHDQKFCWLSIVSTQASHPPGLRTYGGGGQSALGSLAQGDTPSEPVSELWTICLTGQRTTGCARRARDVDDDDGDADDDNNDLDDGDDIGYGMMVMMMMVMMVMMVMLMMLIIMIMTDLECWMMSRYLSIVRDSRT